jgi:hypothetical protein
MDKRRLISFFAIYRSVIGHVSHVNHCDKAILRIVYDKKILSGALKLTSGFFNVYWNKKIISFDYSLNFLMPMEVMQ